MRVRRVDAVDISPIGGMDVRRQRMEHEDMSELVRIIDEYKASHGQPSDSSIARAIGVAPQTISSWRKRGIQQPPAAETLRAIATFMSLPYDEYVLQAAVYDAGMRETMPTLEEANRRAAETARRRSTA